ncbi:phage tail protein [Novosphingobium capsulatum]|uniref:phage tail protein n=1 Tax=Novosphingobium capsulatum TaxID=13688 RepID=UPI00078947DA|nr:phage tail protein [Novosphingobium capsulatum]WQD92566.1 phage tail protein [Novosphingobium capsulatum]
MLFALGLFVFDSQTMLPDRIERDRAFRHARDDRFLAPAASQFVGVGDDKVTLTGTLVPELAGSASAIETLAEMASEGEAWPLMDGTGTILGTYTIDRLANGGSNLIDTGQARKIDFILELTRVA